MKNAIVFYADILGFKEMVSLNNQAVNDKTFLKLKEAKDAIDNTIAELQGQEWNNQSLKDFVTYEMFSDSFPSVSYNKKVKFNKAICLTFYLADKIKRFKSCTKVIEKHS